MLFASVLIRTLWKELSCGYILLLVWGWVLLATSFSEMFGMAIPAWAAFTFIPMVGGSLWCLRRGGGWQSMVQITPYGEMVAMYGAWLAGLFIMSVPLFFFLPPDTIIASRHVCNDAIGHALVAQGGDYLTQSGISRAIFDWYPRATHNLLHYISRLFEVSPVKLLLPFVIFSASFVVTSSWDLAHIFKIRSSTALIGLSALACSPFLNLVSVYAEFLAQTAALPFILMVVIRTFAPNQLLFQRNAILQFALLLVSLSVYTFFPLSICGLALLVKLIVSRPSCVVLRQHIDALLSRPVILVIGSLLCLALPGIVAMVRFLTLQMSGDGIATDILKSAGNLSGYLSPLHISGIWPSMVDYRTTPEKTQIAFQYAQCLVIACALLIISVSDMSKRLRWALFVVAAPAFVFPLIGISEYMHFKYLSVLPPFLLTLSATAWLASTYLTPRLRSAVFCIAVTGAAFWGCWRPGQIIGIWPTLSKEDYREYMGLKRRYFDQGDVLMLSQDDWLRYFADSRDIYLPLIGTLPTPYSGQALRFIIVDKIAAGMNDQFYKAQPTIARLVATTQCLQFSNERYDVYALPCR